MPNLLIVTDDLVKAQSVAAERYAEKETMVASPDLQFLGNEENILVIIVLDPSEVKTFTGHYVDEGAKLRWFKAVITYSEDGMIKRHLNTFCVPYFQDALVLVDGKEDLVPKLS